MYTIYHNLHLTFLLLKLSIFAEISFHFNHVPNSGNFIMATLKS
jgi:hypothetical protein